MKKFQETITDGYTIDHALQTLEALMSGTTAIPLKSEFNTVDVIVVIDALDKAIKATKVAKELINAI